MVNEDVKRPGSIAETLAITEFRRIYLASFASQVGRWMQNVVLGAFAYTTTKSPSFTTFIIFAQMAPMLILSIVGGSLADTLDRRKLLVATQVWQMAWSVVLAVLVADGEIGRAALTTVVLMVGVGQAIYAPAFNAVIPTLVGPRHLSAAISLNSTMINGSRVVGPVLGAATLAAVGPAAVFGINAATYLFVIVALIITPMPTHRPTAMSMGDRLLGGLRLALRSPQVGRPLLTMSLFSFFCLPFIGLMPVLAEERWGVAADGPIYGALYACFGLGALVGAGAVGTILIEVPKSTVVRWSLAGFAVALATLAVVRSAVPAAVVLFAVGLFYFTMPTALTTFLQEHLGDEVRGRVMALWTIAFGGFVSLTNLVSGLVVESTSLPFVLLVGAAAAVALGLWVRLDPGPVADEAMLHSPTPTPA